MIGDFNSFRYLHNNHSSFPAGNYMFKVNNRNTIFTTCSSVSFVNFEQVNADWVRGKYLFEEVGGINQENTAMYYSMTP